MTPGIQGRIGLRCYFRYNLQISVFPVAQYYKGASGYV
ncbi:hypothetical protein cbdbB44 [Dehalococcoides mccartyi CBDB1]|uniref:Uncharacterized protein n=1 Tax=Dehalococcoides mccartyi (strain CBDB1) TaxID=255470 RepID=A0A916KNH3_DEHMC|nr:hypothetical protein cbdbB44 [Dehalococcoides mccartyi CBDB1]